MSKLIITIGILLVIVGVLWPLLQKLGLGHLPGDIVIQKKNFTFYFPITTAILLSLIVSFILWLFGKIF